MHCFLGCCRYTADWLYASQTDNTGVYHADLLRKVLVAVKENRRGKLTQVPILLHNNASAHRSHVGQADVLECGLKTLCHPPHSPNQTTYVSKFKETPPWTEIFDRWGAQVCGQRVVEVTVINFYFTGIKSLRVRFTVLWQRRWLYRTRGQSNLTKSASRGANSPVRGHPRGSKFAPLNSWGRGSY